MSKIGQDLIYREREYSYLRAIGDVAKVLVRNLLEGCDYEVHPFGYESFITHIKDLIRKSEVKCPFTDRLSSMPDLIVVDQKNELLELVEVKYTSRKPSNIGISGKTLARYMKYWPGSKLVIVTPHEEVFYAAGIHKKGSGESRLEVKEGKVSISPPSTRIRDRKKSVDINPDHIEAWSIVDFILERGDRIDKWFPLIENKPLVLEQMSNLALELFEKIPK